MEHFAIHYRYMYVNENGEPDEVLNYDIFCDALFKKRLEIAESIVRNDFKKMLKRKPFNTLLHLAVEQEDISAIEYLLSNRASIKFKNTLGETPLHLAVRKNNAEILDIICSHITYGHKEKTNINPTDSQGLSHMHIACISNNSLNDLHVQHFLEQGVPANIPVNFNSPQWPGYTPLHFAVEHGNMRVAKLLLQSGADVSLKNGDGATALHIAFLKSSICMVDLLLEAHQSLEPGSVNPSNQTGLSHFHIACSQKNASIVQGFIERGADVNAHVNFDTWDYCGFTPLHMAVHFRSSDTIGLLIKYGANIAAKEARGSTPLHLAFENGYKKIVNLILSSAAQQNNPKNPVNQWSLSHFHIACVHNNLDMMKNFLESGVAVDEAVHVEAHSFPGYTALHFAAEFERVEAAELLLKWNARVDIKDCDGLTPLHVACQQNFSKISHLIQQNVDVDSRMHRYELESKVSEFSKWFNGRTEYRSMIELLLRYNSDVNCRDYFDRTPIYHACEISPKILEQFAVKVTASLVNKFESTRFEIVKLLVDSGADIFARNECTGKTVLYHLVELDECLFFIDRSKVKIAELLLKKGVEASVRIKNGMTPLHLAVTKGLPKVVKLLLTNNADVNTAEHINLETPLHKACENLHADIAQMLLDNGADVTARKKNGQTALHEVVSSTDFDFTDANAKATSDLVVRLLDAGCDVNVQDYEGKTPLHVACSTLNFVGAQVLLHNGADINLEDDSGKAPLSYCLFHCRGNFHRIYYIFYEHITKIKYIGYHVSKKNKAYFSRIGKMHNYFSVESARYLSGEYIKEFHKMSSKKIGTSSLNEMLQKDANQLAVYAKNKTFRKIVTAKKFSEMFPFFGYLLKLQYKKGCARLKAMKSAKLALEYLIRRELPDACAELIFKDLDNENLKHLVVASETAIEIHNSQ
ncbi:serine/threonine-protein phosphatase 6 regulatory ankyrin repeat subunit A [Nasonia vitripennis]|uniref:Uncharacterized protein n=1 Tax=Nasonia vitripennis TaxID=7425 RepID=A0A7M7LQU2_NASVI|nr:serine/threonine-protein phosphatase 6 regulatory ankyrin repeat subunit A [Nasonia vitripennis]XP_031783529.1 serine/threonine-protein phosphatase 6 regulatory ankyrin repeat subunit A [Nasonia vitripennis]